MMSRVLPLILPLVAAAQAAAVSLSVPSASTRDIDPNFIALGFEQASFVRFVLDNDNNTNVFSSNLIEGITNRTGGQAIIRLGGTSADYATYLPGQTEPCLPVAEANIEDSIGGTTVGPSFWELTKRFPDAAYMIQVPLATTNASETVAWVQSACDIMDADQIFVFEIGNEPEWYSETYTGTGDVVLGPPSWQGKFTNETYVGNWTTRANDILGAVSNLPDQPIFQAFDTAAHVGVDSSVLAYELSYNVTFPLGINKGGYIKAAAQHYYQNKAKGKVVETDLMDLESTHARMDYLGERASYLENDHPEVKFVLSEVANSLGARPEYQTVLGSALWLVDFYLYSMKLGVQRVHYQQMVNSGFLPRMWLPVSSAGETQQVYSNYYAAMLVGDFISNTGNASMAVIDTSADSDLSAYAAFEGGEVKRVSIVNMNYWDGSSSSSRASTEIQLSVPSSIQSVTVAKLTSSEGALANATTITYGGSQWTYESMGYEATGVTNDTETISVVDGVATVSVDASSAVLITLL